MSPQQPGANIPSSPPVYWFVLGREPLLSLAEITAALSLAPGAATMINQACARVSHALIPETLMRQLGGTIKIGRELLDAGDNAAAYQTILQELKKISHKIHFGISTSKNLPEIADWGKQIKKELVAEGLSVRYVAPVRGHTSLSSATVWHNDLVRKGREFLIEKTNDGAFSVAITAAVQPLEEWSERDFGRPGRDDVSGMLPPKLARMLINIASAPLNGTLLDPFCGSGTILTEALMVGYAHVTGSDLSERAVADTEKNLAWLRTHYPERASYKVTAFVSDFRALPEKCASSSVDAIVTEPFLGPALRGRESAAQIKKNANDLLPLYLDFLAVARKLLKPGGVLVMVSPRWQAERETISFKARLVEQAKKSGLAVSALLPPTLSAEPFLVYQRPGQRVAREIWRFTKNPA